MLLYPNLFPSKATNWKSWVLGVTSKQKSMKMCAGLIEYVTTTFDHDEEVLNIAKE
jgi:hypothetical protein